MIDKPDAATVVDLVDRMRPILANHHPGEQGAALAELLSLWLCGHPRMLRYRLLAMHVELVNRLNEVHAEAPNANKT